MGAREEVESTGQEAAPQQGAETGKGVRTSQPIGELYSCVSIRTDQK
jgi:hypothetical protein